MVRLSIHPQLVVALVCGVAFIATIYGCVTAETPSSVDRSSLPRGVAKPFGAAPSAPTGPLSPEVARAIDTAFGENLESGTWDERQVEALERIAQSGDARMAWIISDLMRIALGLELRTMLTDAANQLLGTDIKPERAWGDTTDHLIAWDIPAPPGYLDVKRTIFTIVVPEWERLFVEGDIDWRHVSWGGVRIDDRPFNETDKACNCIPAADNPQVTDAAGATWLDDDAVVFGIEVNGEYRAYPRRIMEVREMVNDTLGGRDLGIPYCTLCGSAQAYFTDRMPEGVKRPVLRTSGLLIRSNKVMYDINTFSVFDTFLGKAVTGPLAKRGIVLQQTGVVTTTWGQWKSAHPETTVLIEALALGRDFDFRNGRDANGPIFPIGDVDTRLPVHEDVLGIVTDKGTPIAFHIKSALAVLGKGEPIAFDNVRLVLDGGGVRAVDANGKDLGGHQAFWFAWSQFHPETKLWP
ncbi:DUF3179 domain-containing (seleno)protein, partial [Candidatus Entotheonella palauensis]|uniref:DUF3179 domain-containing (seleno)protein n=1 Tax=Candidatus Entotheonella palauensis TaxID=93172 RepID=UPI000B7D8804